MTASRQEGFTCPFKDCGRDHSLGDCSQDVTLAKVMDRVSIEVAHSRRSSDTPTLLDERPRWRNVVDSSKEPRYPASRILSGGRLVATYTMTEIGELKYDSEVAYQTMSPTGDNYEQCDIDMLADLKEATKTELDCQVCYALMLDPLTTTCGHTFCRKCVARMLDHSTMCPICRRHLPMPPGVQSVPGNKRLSKLLSTLCPDLVAARAEAAAQEEVPMLGETNVPLFICTLAYPSMPTFLHIFEPRYRLMIRRAIDSGEGKFGMLMYNRRAVPQGSLGSVQFLQYGTLVRINSVEIMPDGRSMIETRGISRFRVKDWDMHDGYVVGNIERLDDISLAEEEQVEATETTGPAPTQHDLISQIDYMSTQELLKVGTDFITRMQAASAPWLNEGVLASYGPPPDDPAIFPYWFASILPIGEEEKYRLIPTTSVRERLKITARWVRRIEAQRCPPSRDDTESSDSSDEGDVSATDGDSVAQTTDEVRE
ncbi:hypothetical protein IMSHALPRED_010706 [Imshaugia aleurites]|uniref:LON peptidase N-terminal domain and RING finger protein 1 n=1 Tax=Imshaugia aleurites TaxID=172621 RepID=A0A8H3IZX5_9LECA|nr:hypothetical protein IMSHALPRED_010706 [Imshaugia aleurites]